MATTSLTIFEALSKEFRCDEDGNGFSSLRGLARMCGVAQGNWGKSRLKGDVFFTLKIDEYLADGGFCLTDIDLSNGVPDYLAAEVIGFYAEEQQNPTAKKYSRAFRAYGLRKAIQDVVGYKPVQSRRLTQSEVVELCILPTPSSWQRRFPEEYYEQLSRLTGLNAFGNSRPPLWAAKTKELVYDYLPNGVYAAVKRCKAETGGYEKLHQFLSEDGLKILEQHQRQLLTLMQASATMKQLKTSLDQACSKTYQLLLIEAA
jgi:hypothetical protein